MCSSDRNSSSWSVWLPSSSREKVFGLILLAAACLLCTAVLMMMMRARACVRVGVGVGV